MPDRDNETETRNHASGSEATYIPAPAHLSPITDEEIDWAARERVLDRLLAMARQRHPFAVHADDAEVSRPIVENCMAWAQHFGVCCSTPHAIFTDLMLTIAPNFFLEPEINDNLHADDMDPCALVETLNDYVDDDAWRRATAARRTWPLYLGPNAVGLDIAKQTEIALALLAGQKIPADRIRAAASRGAAFAAKNGLERQNPDAAIVAGTCALLYRPPRPDPLRTSWLIRVLQRSGPQADQVVARLRHRLADDFHFSV